MSRPDSPSARWRGDADPVEVEANWLVGRAKLQADAADSVLELMASLSDVLANLRDTNGLQAECHVVLALAHAADLRAAILAMGDVMARKIPPFVNATGELLAFDIVDGRLRVVPAAGADARMRRAS